MKIKYFLVAIFLTSAILFSAGFVSAQTSQTQDQITQQLIQLLTQMIAQLQQEIAIILAQYPIKTPVPAPIVCTQNWQCAWSSCMNGIQTQKWTDLNNCGQTLENVGICPFISQACAPSVQQPTITYVQAYAENQNIVHAGERTFIYGNNLSGVTAIYLGSRIVTMDRTATTNSNLVFTAPSDLTSGTATIYVQTVAGAISNSITVQIVASSPTQPSITVTSPNGGQIYNIGSIIPITFTTSGLVGAQLQAILINTITNQTVYGLAVFTNRTDGTQTVNEQIPSTVPAGNNYAIKMIGMPSSMNCNITAPGCVTSAISAGSFSIVTPTVAVKGDLNGDGIVNGADLAIFSACLNVPMTDSCRVADLNGDGRVDFADLFIFRQVYAATPMPTITVASPNGGEQWAQGSTHNITWNSSILNNSSGAKVQLQLTNVSSDNPQNRQMVNLITQSTENNGVYAWQIPSSIPAGQYLIYALLNTDSGATKTLASDFSDNSFNIYRPTGDLNGDGVVNSADLAIFSSCLNVPMTDSCKVADLNGDGQVDFADLFIFRQAYNAATAQ